MREKAVAAVAEILDYTERDGCRGKRKDDIAGRRTVQDDRIATHTGQGHIKPHIHFRKTVSSVNLTLDQRVLRLNHLTCPSLDLSH